MAIAKRPNRNLSDITPITDDAAAEAFILAAEKPALPQEVPAPAATAVTATAKRKKIPVLLRIEQDAIDAVDRQADRLGLSRAGWIRMVIARELEREGSGS